MSCPCESGQPLEKCCEPYIDGEARPPTAEALMRSRFTAYAIGEIDYIISTHDPQTAKGLDKEATRQWAEQADWLGLHVLRTEDGAEQDEEGVVEFVARYETAEGEKAHHEVSTFKKRDGRWYFHDGKVVTGEPVVRSEPKVGRNDPCPCGSGKKYKKCCGRPGAAATK